MTFMCCREGYFFSEYQQEALGHNPYFPAKTNLSLGG